MGRTLWGGMTVLAFLVAAYAVVNVLAPGVRSPFVGAMFADETLRAFGHLAFGGVALAAGALQFSGRLRTRRPGLHRRLGMLYVVAVTVSGVSAVALAVTTPGGLPARSGFGILGVLWVGTALTALVRARAGDYDAHRAWMIRSYALCLAAVTLRIYLPLGEVLGVPFEASYPAIAWLCWVPNLIVAEWYVIRSAWLPIHPAARA